MYDTRFTAKKVTEKAHKSRKLRTVTTPDGNCLCGVSKTKICDLNGEQIATFSRKEQRVENDKTITVRVYESSYGEFVVKKNHLYLGDEYLGVMPDKKYFIPILIFFLLGFLLAALIMTFVLLDHPKDKIIVIDVADHSGTWAAQGTVAVLDEIIHPDTDGKYHFFVRNTSDVELLYDFFD